MEEEEENPFGVHSPASERGTLASISTHLNPHQAMILSNKQESLEVQEEIPPRTILLVGTYRPIGTYLGQEKTVQEQNRGARRTNT